MVLSYSSSWTMERVAASCNPVRFYQLIKAQILKLLRMRPQMILYVGRHKLCSSARFSSHDSVLEEVVHAVEGKIHVLMDGGVRQGTDIFKALTVGPRSEGLLSMASHRVRRVIEMLKDELELTMARFGCPKCEAYHQEPCQNRA
ncbi:hypothetical protein Pint_29277 [Pistacia integerrima]|uniref:Uncharacterized protein n=1 Tax=Pistacia integerrima TaxID=434235 RepID=A0ACC0X167_9ROSI|nr:hypothetical protein Pint_29277 [Pistacia integerrima]